jgi:pimeloyl-ACP methyl ester carboxylesterase
MNPTIIDLKGKKIAIRSSGVGEKIIVFIHGASSSSVTWLAQLNDEVLKKKYRLAAVDLPGHGGSEWSKQPAGYELGSLAETIKNLISTLQPKKFVLVGLSYGSNVIGEIIPPLKGCAGIMLVSPCILNNQFSPDKILIPAPLSHVMTAENPPENELKEFINHATNDASVAERFHHTYRNTDPAFRREFGNTFLSGKWTDELSNIQNWRVPVCVVFGKHETLIKSDYLNHYAALWNNRVYKIDKAGHMAHEENPIEFNEILTGFVSAVLE